MKTTTRVLIAVLLLWPSLAGAAEPPQRLWTFWVTYFDAAEDTQVGPPTQLVPYELLTPESTFQTYADCERDKQRHIDFMVSMGMSKRIGKDMMEPLYPLQHGAKLIELWECKEIEATPPPSMRDPFLRPADGDGFEGGHKRVWSIISVLKIW